MIYRQEDIDRERSTFPKYAVGDLIVTRHRPGVWKVAKYYFHTLTATCPCVDVTPYDAIAVAWLALKHRPEQWLEFQPGEIVATYLDVIDKFKKAKHERLLRR